MRRRRFLAISAAMLAAGPLAARTRRWDGVALGAEVSITLRGETEAAEAVLSGVRDILRRVEGIFSLYDPASDLSRLNRTGGLRNAPDAMRELFAITDVVHGVTDGIFDPSIQSRWVALARGAGRVGTSRWRDIRREGGTVRLAPGQALTFNGIAQGFATDLVSAHLARAGFSRTLVNIGEYRAGDGQWRIGIEDPDFGPVGIRSLSRRSIATSSPAALGLGPDHAHILHPGDPDRQPLWSTVSVEAPTAAMADGLSTAMCFMTRAAIAGISGGGCRVTLVSGNGDITTLG